MSNQYTEENMLYAQKLYLYAQATSFTRMKNSFYAQNTYSYAQAA